MATISRLSVVLNASTAGLKKGLGKARGMLKKFSSKILNVKAALVGAFGVLGAGALVSDSLSAFKKQEQAVASWQASLKSMGRTTKGFDERIQKLASRIQAEGIIGDEAILEGAAFLSTFDKISDEMMPRAIRAMVDLAAKTGGSTTNAAKLLGKASMGLVGALSIAGISLSDATKKSKDFGDILTEIEQQVGGINAELGATASGGITQFGNAVGDAKEKLGEIVAVAISPFLRLFSQEMAGATMNAQALGESFRDWIIESAKALAWITDIPDTFRLVWHAISGIVRSAISGILGFIALFARGINAITAPFTSEKLIPQKEIESLESKMTRLSDVAQKSLTFHVPVLFDILTESGGMVSRSTLVRRQIDEIANKAAVAEMKSRLGIAGGPNFATSPAARANVGPQIVTDPQLETTNARLQQMVDIMGSFGVRAG